MTTSAEQIRAWQGPAILCYGYRPFFLLGGIWAAMVMVLWVPMLTGAIPSPSVLAPVDWNAHTLLFGYGTAVVAGFLTTAVPKWTGLFPIVGWPLGGLVALWVLGRCAVSTPLGLSPLTVALADLAFPVVFAAAIGREIVAGKNWRNLKVLALLALLTAANALFHWEAARTGYGAGGYGLRAGLAALIALIALIGGRIVPSFTRNWLAKQRALTMPAPAGRMDNVVMAITLPALVLWVIWPDTGVTGAALVLAGLANLFRLARWQGHRTLAEPLVWVLHVGWLFVPLGFLALGAEALGLLGSDSGAQHLWMAGAVGLMTVAVMTRASLGHAGLPLVAGRGVAGLYLALIVSVAARFAAGLAPQQGWLLHLAATGWVLGFAGFAVLYWPILTKSRRR